MDVAGGSQEAPCHDEGLTGYGQHIIIHDRGKGYVEDVEIFRMGQSTVLGRYLHPLSHFGRWM